MRLPSHPLFTTVAILRAHVWHWPCRVPEAAVDPVTPRSLRARVNLVALPILALPLALFTAVDYWHEHAAITATHALHDMGSTAAAEGPAAPAAIAGRSLRVHVVASAIMLAVLAVGLNAVLTRFVLKPLADVEHGIEQMQRGHWIVTLGAARAEEVERVVEKFRALGPTVGAMMLHALQAERLATIALLSKRVAGKILPELDRLGDAVGRLGRDDPEVQHDVAAAAARIRCAVRELDQIFTAATRVERHQ